jgi:hypothetical protein
VIPDELRIFEMSGVTGQGHLARAVWAAHIVDGQFVPVEIPLPAGTVIQ